MMPQKPMEFIENESIPDEEFMDEIQAEIDDAPQDPDELLERLSVHNSSSPADSGGDIDAEWEEVNTTGEESVFGSNPTPDQSNVEENAHAMGIDYQDNEPLDFLEKLEKRDRDRFELDESSKGGDGSI